MKVKKRTHSVFLDCDRHEVVAEEDVAVVVELEVADRPVAPERIPRSRGQHFESRARFLNKLQVLVGLSLRVGGEQKGNSRMLSQEGKRFQPGVL